MNANAGAGTRSKRACAAWLAAALGVFLLALATVFRGFWGGDLERDVPFPTDRIAGPVVTADYQMTVWATSRNAWTLLHRPAALFDAEPCYPDADSLTIYHPLLALGLLAVPVQLASGEPVAAFNSALFLKVLIAALAMYLLIADWTRSPAAGIAAGLLYAFATLQIGKPFQVHHADNAWLLLALCFGRRLVESGRWRDALATGAFAALQMGSSFYPLLVAATVAVPMAAWLLWRARRRPRSLVLLLVAAGMALATAAFVLRPYLEVEATGQAQRVLHLHAAWSSFLPGGSRFPGWSCVLLALAALLLGRERALAGIRGDPRAALVLAALLLALLATGGSNRALLAARSGAEAPAIVLPNLYAALANRLPGLHALRVVADLSLGVQQVLCILAGLGAAALLRLLPRKAFPWAAAALIAIAFVDATHAGLPGLSPQPAFGRLALRPPAATLAFFRDLERQGDRGPLLEVPIRMTESDGKLAAAWKSDLTRDQFLTAYHHRRTSSCLGARFQLRAAALDRLSHRLLEPGGVDALRERGFATVVVHHPPGRAFEQRYAREVARLASASEGRLVPIASGESLTAYALRPPR